MSTRRVLDISSTKKSDTMPCYTNIDQNADGTSSTFVLGGALFPGAAGAEADFFVTCFCPTARSAIDTRGNFAPRVLSHVRTAQTIYASGYSEKVEISTTTGHGWQWRRVCVSMKGDAFNGGNDDSQTSLVFRETSNGYMRLMTPANRGTINSVLFKGTQGRDWYDPTTAQIDTKRVKLHSDSYVTIKSGNQNGVTIRKRFWYPLRKNIVYRDDEDGNIMNESHFSVQNKQGMGDFYVIDFFQPNRGGKPEDNLLVAPQGTFYWHEK